MYEAVGPLAHTEPGGTVEAPAGYGWYRAMRWQFRRKSLLPQDGRQAGQMSPNARILA